MDTGPWFRITSYRLEGERIELLNPWVQGEWFYPLHHAGCIVTINVLWLFLTVPWVGLQYVLVVFPDHTHLLFLVCYSDKHFMNSSTDNQHFI